MERTPKQRIIFDEDMYDDEFLRDYLAEDYEIYKDELDVSFDEYVEHRRNEGALYDIKERDFTEEMASLRSFLDNGNPLIVSGSIERWDGTRTGFTVYDNFDAAIDTSPSRFGGDNVFADCEIQKVWDENGHLFIHGAHHDGNVTVELRQLTDAGAVTYEAISEAWNGEPFTIIGNNATDWAFKTYDGSEQSFIQAMALLIVLHPRRVAQLAVDGDLRTLQEVLGQLLGTEAEQGTADEDGGILPFARLDVLALLVHCDGEVAHLGAVRKVADIGVSRKVALDYHAVDSHV